MKIDLRHSRHSPITPGNERHLREVIGDVVGIEVHEAFIPSLVECLRHVGVVVIAEPQRQVGEAVLRIA